MSRILLIDDDAILQRIYAVAFQRNHLEHVGAASGEAGLALLAREPDFRVIVVDLHLPGIDGIETIRRVRLIPGYARTPILLFTATVDADLHRQAAAIGGVEVLDKGLIGPLKLIERLRVALESSSPALSHSESGSVSGLHARVVAVGEQAHHALKMLRGACLALDAQLAVSAESHPGALVGLQRAVALLEAASRRSLADLGSERALAVVADDDAVTRGLIIAAMRKYRMAAASFFDGEALLDAVHHGPCDLVISDLLMPRRSGVAVVNSLRHDYPRLPLIIVTALPAERQSFSEKYHPDEVVIKPFLLAELAMKAWYHVIRSRLGWEPQPAPRESDPWKDAM